MKSNNDIKLLINSFIKKILELDGTNKSLEEKLNIIDDLLNNLIDYCIKKKIIYYIEHKIGYNSIITNFKQFLTNYIQKLTDPNNTLIKNYLDDGNNFDNVSDLNSIMFQKFKNSNEFDTKNVSFRDNISLISFEDKEGFEFNYKTKSLKNEDNDDVNNNFQENSLDISKLPLYIKILINKNMYLIEFTEKIFEMCKIISSSEIKYKSKDPYSSLV
jgi:hypothetical protein